MIPQLLSWGSVILKTVSKLTDDNEDINKASDVLDDLGTAYNVLSTRSVSQSAGRAIIAPMTVFEESLTHQDYMLDLMTVINMRDIRDALTHINFQSKVGDLRIGELVDQINPNRSAGFMCFQGCEAFNVPKKNILNKKDDNKDDDRVRVDGSEIRSITEYSPLALGRTVNAAVSINGKEVNFPLTFRQIPIPASSNDLELMFKAVKGGAGWSESIKDYKSGAITLPELLTGVNDIRQEYKIRTQDMSGYYGEAVKRERGNKLAALRTGIMSMNTMANTIIMSKDTADNIELDIGIRFGSSKMGQIRKHVRANTIVVVNDQRGIFEFYSSSSNIVEKFTASQIKTKVNKEDVNTLEALVKLLGGR